MRLSIILFLLCCHTILYSQNLVPNPSFEELNDTISGFINSNYEFIEIIKSWTIPNPTTPDVITPDFDEGYIKPPDTAHSGLNMIGFKFTEHRFKQIFWCEYVGVELLKELMPDRTYYVEFWIQRANCSNQYFDNDELTNKFYGILFTPDSLELSNPDMYVGSPQIVADPPLFITDMKWVKISKYFTPKEVYKYLYIGQFRKEANDTLHMKGYYVIDDVKVVEVVDLASLDKDTELPVGSIIPLSNVHFVSGTTRLSEDKSHEMLRDLENYLNSKHSVRIRINGHTDSIGGNRSNQSLSEGRARKIAQILIRRGISRERIEWKGFGEENPIADNITDEGRAKNRRVEFEIVE